MSTNRGFSLVEVLIVVALFGIAFVLVVDLLVGHNRIFQIEGAQIDTAGSARDILDIFVETASQASSVLPSTVVNGVTYTSGATTTVLSLPSVTSAGDLITGQSDVVVLHASSTEFYIFTTLGSGSARRADTRRLSDTIKQVTFAYDNADVTLATSATLTLTTEKISRGDTVQYTAKGRATLRNH